MWPCRNPSIEMEFVSFYEKSLKKYAMVQDIKKCKNNMIKISNGWLALMYGAYCSPIKKVLVQNRMVAKMRMNQWLHGHTSARLK